MRSPWGVEVYGRVTRVGVLNRQWLTNTVYDGIVSFNMTCQRILQEQPLISKVESIEVEDDHFILILLEYISKQYLGRTRWIKTLYHLEDLHHPPHQIPPFHQRRHLKMQKQVHLDQNLRKMVELQKAQRARNVQGAKKMKALDREIWKRRRKLGIGLLLGVNW